MKRKSVFWTSVAIVLLVTLAMLMWTSYDNSQKVEFIDEEMGGVIVNQAYREGEILNDNAEEIRLYHLENIKELNIGYTGYYTTLVDIESCSNLEELYIGAPIKGGYNYYMSWRELPEPESEERIEQIQNELASILLNCDKLETLYIWDYEGRCQFNNLDFIKNTDSLQLLCVASLKIDCTSIWECITLKGLALWDCDIHSLDGISKLKKLEYLNLNGTNIVEAGDILNLQNLESLYIENTPLAENEEELKLIYETFPDITIYK